MTKDEAMILADKLYAWKALGQLHLKKLKKDLDHSPEETLQWLKESTREIVEARALVPEHMWEGYKLLNLTGLREQGIFYEARKKTVQYFKTRYPYPEKRNDSLVNSEKVTQ